MNATDREDRGDRADVLGKCSSSSPAIFKALIHFIANVTRDGGLHSGIQDVGPEGSHFLVNETHYAAWVDDVAGAAVNGAALEAPHAAVCTVAKEDLRRLGLATAAMRDPLYIVVPITCVYALIFLFGLLGNVSTCIVIARNRHMHTATNYYLFSLALSDLLLLVCGLPPEICHIWSRYPYLFGEVFCFLQGFAAETSANATVFTITAFTMERYVAICRPFRARAMSSPPRAVRCVLASWALALVLAVPPATQFGVVVRGRDALGRDMSECTVKRVLVSHAFLLSTGLVFVAPLLVISVLYILIGLRLRRSRRALAARRHSAGSTGSVRASGSAGSAASQARVIRMLVAVVVAFFICWAPFHAQRLLAVYASPDSQRHDAIRALYNALTYMSGVLYYLSTTVNPVLYHIMSNKFREAFKNTLRTECGWWRRRSDARRRQSYANLSGRALGVACPACPCPQYCGPACGPACGPHSHCGSTTLTTTFDERNNTYSTVEERGTRSHRSVRCCLSAADVQDDCLYRHQGLHGHSGRHGHHCHPAGRHGRHGDALGDGGLRADHSAISNSSLQEWDRAEQGGAELAELVQYMGELNRRHAAKL
ncbi:pyrokinin-1 receptor-like [Thrips palmi]|uniref:Pyrokinin-1 receptor-like n=1 Tax=Thrips palmi TaxID=161013 RepID=A0A6P8ZNH9_THRPL|nr:pyrokinin-1 receptor-like [Thrips palmi]